MNVAVLASPLPPLPLLPNTLQQKEALFSRRRATDSRSSTRRWAEVVVLSRLKRSWEGGGEGERHWHCEKRQRKKERKDISRSAGWSAMSRKERGKGRKKGRKEGRRGEGHTEAGLSLSSSSCPVLVWMEGRKTLMPTSKNLISLKKKKEEGPTESRGRKQGRLKSYSHHFFHHCLENFFPPSLDPIYFVPPFSLPPPLTTHYYQMKRKHSYNLRHFFRQRMRDKRFKARKEVSIFSPSVL